MAHDVYLVVAEPAAGAIVVRRWLGGNAVSERALAVLKRSPEIERAGERAWAVRPEEVLAVSGAHYSGGATPAQVNDWTTKYPADGFWWTLIDAS